MIQQRDFDNLYQLLKGSPVANLIVDAKTAFIAKDFESAKEQVTSATALYEQRQVKKERRDKEREQSRGKPSARRAKLIAEKQEKKSNTFAGLERLSNELDRLIAANQSQPQSENSDSSISASRTSSVTEAITDEELTMVIGSLSNADSFDGQAHLLGERFDMLPVDSYEDLSGGAVLHVRTKQGGFLVRCLSRVEDATTVDLKSLIDGKSLRPQKKQQLLQEGRKGRLKLVVPRGTKKQVVDQDGPQGIDEVAVPEEEGTGVDSVLDMGAFTQLQDAAQRSGLVPGSDLIAHVRDREFRMGDYTKAFQTIEGLFGKFSAAATQREQRLRKEDVDIASGRIKISPKELQIKRARDTADNQKIARTRSRFSRVMEGLRVILLNEQKQKDEQAKLEN